MLLKKFVESYRKIALKNGPILYSYNYQKVHNYGLVVSNHCNKQNDL